MDCQNILLATDLSNAGIHATQAAVALAKQNNAKLTALLVVSIPAVYSIGHKSFEQIEQELHETAQPALEAYAREHQIPESATLLIAVGSPKEQIIKTTKAIKADLLVIGSHGEHGLSEHIGSTISAVLQKVSTNVFVAHPTT